MPFSGDPAKTKSPHVTCQIHLFCCLMLSLEKSKLPSVLLEKHQHSIVGWSFLPTLTSFRKDWQWWWAQHGLPAQEGRGWCGAGNTGSTWLHRVLSRRVWSEVTQWTRSLPECAGKGEHGDQSRRHCEVWKFKWVLQPLGQILLGCFLDNRCYNRCTSSFSVIIWVVSIDSLSSRSGKPVLQLAYI